MREVDFLELNKLVLRLLDVNGRRRRGDIPNIGRHLADPRLTNITVVGVIQDRHLVELLVVVE